MHRNFFPDVIASFPLDLLVWGPGCWQHAAARLNKVLRVKSVRSSSAARPDAGDRQPWHRLVQSRQDTLTYRHLLQSLAAIEELGLASQLSIALQVAKQATAILVVAHWLGCGYLVVSFAEGLAPQAGAWLPPMQIETLGPWEQYLYALWWSVDCISGANIGGENSPDSPSG